MLCAICFDTEGEIIPAHENFSHMFHPECLTVALESLNSFSCPLCFTKIDLKLVTSLAINEELRLTYDTGNLSKFGELVENDEIDIGDNLKYILIHDRPAEFLQVLMDHLIANELTINLASDLRYALSHGKLYLAKILVRTIILRPDLTYIFRSLYRVLEFIAKEKSLFCLFAQNMESSQSLVFFYEDCEMGLLEKVALWIECLPDLLTDGHLYEALCRTANEGKYDVCKFLLSYTEGRTFFDEHQRLLRSVCNNRWWDLYKAFESIQFGTYIDYNIPFTMAISDMNWNLAKNLWKRGGRLKEQEWSKCLLANINLCDVIGIKSLLDRGKYSIYNNVELLVRACELGFVEAVQILIEYGVNIHANHGRALIVTCQRSKVKILEFLLSNIQGNEPYFLDAINTAASFGSNRILGMLLNFIKERKCCLPFRYYEKILTNTALTADQIKSFYHAFIRPKLWKANILGNFNDLERAKITRNFINLMCIDARYGHFFQIIRNLLDMEPEHSEILIWRFPPFSKKQEDQLRDHGKGYRKNASQDKFRELMDCSDIDRFEAQKFIEIFNFDYAMTILDVSCVFLQNTSKRILRRKLFGNFP